MWKKFNIDSVILANVSNIITEINIYLIFISDIDKYKLHMLY